MSMAWSVGDVAWVSGFKARHDLNKCNVRLLEWLPASLRWRVAVQNTGELVSVVEDKLFTSVAAAEQADEERHRAEEE